MTAAPLRIIFAGTPDFAAHHLAILLASRHQVIAAYSQPDRPAGRGKKLTASPVKQLALTHEIPVYQPVGLKNAEAQQALRDLQADVMVVVAYGLILPQVVLDTPRLGCINVHASLLPRWRGAAPIQRALAAGDRETGVTIMQMDAGLDTGPMLKKTHCSINEDDTGGSLHDKLAAIGGPALLSTLDDIAAGNASPEIQNDDSSCYAAKINKQEQAIDWTEPAVDIARRIRAFNPFPVAYSELDNQRVKLWMAQPLDETSVTPGTIIRSERSGIDVASGLGVVRIIELQLPGGKALNTAAALNGYGALFTPGRQFNQP